METEERRLEGEEKAKERKVKVIRRRKGKLVSAMDCR